MYRHSWFSKLVQLTIFTIALGCLTACVTPQIENHGYYLGGIESKLAQLKLGQTTQAEAQKILGSASLSYRSVQDTGDIWVYVNYQIRKYLFKRPKVIKRQMFKLTFDNRDILQEVTPIQDLPVEENSAKLEE